jgi:hypothetical protein
MNPLDRLVVNVIRHLTQSVNIMVSVSLNFRRLESEFYLWHQRLRSAGAGGSPAAHTGLADAHAHEDREAYEPRRAEHVALAGGPQGHDGQRRQLLSSSTSGGCTASTTHGEVRGSGSTRAASSSAQGRQW